MVSDQVIEWPKPLRPWLVAILCDAEVKLLLVRVFRFLFFFDMSGVWATLRVPGMLGQG